MGEALSTWEMIALGAIGLIVIFLFYPGLKRLNQESHDAKKDWPGFLLPIGAVIVFIVLLVMIV